MVPLEKEVTEKRGGVKVRKRGSFHGKCLRFSWKKLDKFQKSVIILYVYFIKLISFYSVL